MKRRKEEYGSGNESGENNFMVKYRIHLANDSILRLLCLLYSSYWWSENRLLNKNFFKNFLIELIETDLRNPGKEQNILALKLHPDACISDIDQRVNYFCQVSTKSDMSLILAQWQSRSWTQIYVISLFLFFWYMLKVLFETFL